MKLKLALWAAGATLLVLLTLRVLHWRHEAMRVSGLEDQIASMTEAFELERAARSTEQTRHDAVVKGLNDELTQLAAARAARPVRTIRVCDEAPPAARVPAAEPAPGASDEPATTGSGTLQPGAGRDIGPATFALMDEADAMLASFRALRQWAASLPACAPVAQ